MQIQKQLQQNQPDTTQSEVPPKPSPQGDVRERILAEATRLFSSKGFHGVSVREIVEASGITKPTLYYYFHNKAHLFEQIIGGSLAEFRKQIEEALNFPGSLRERLVRVCEAHFDFARRYADQCRLTYRLYYSPARELTAIDIGSYFRRNTEMISELLAEGIESGEIRPASPWFMALSLLGVLNVLVTGMLHNPSVIPPVGLAESVVDLLLEGFAPRSAEEKRGWQGR